MAAAMALSSVTFVHLLPFISAENYCRSPLCWVLSLLLKTQPRTKQSPSYDGTLALGRKQSKNKPIHTQYDTDTNTTTNIYQGDRRDEDGCGMGLLQAQWSAQASAEVTSEQRLEANGQRGEEISGRRTG